MESLVKVFRGKREIFAASPHFSGLLDPILLIQASITHPSTFSERRGIHEYLIGKLEPAGVPRAEKPPGQRAEHAAPHWLLRRLHFSHFSPRCYWKIESIGAICRDQRDNNRIPHQMELS
jgi:hypothetical protein